MFNWDSFPILKTSRFTLRQQELDDAPAIYDCLSDDRVMKYFDMETLSNISQAVDIVNWQKDRFKNRTGIRWGIAKNEDNSWIGSCGLHSFSWEDQKAEIGYEVTWKYWNQGVTSEILPALLEFAFSVLKLNRVQATFHPDNSASERVLLKNGFIREGILRDYLYHGGRFVPAVICSLLRSDQRQLQTIGVSETDR